MAIQLGPLNCCCCHSRVCARAILSNERLAGADISFNPCDLCECNFVFEQSLVAVLANEKRAITTIVVVVVVLVVIKQAVRQRRAFK